MTREESIKKFLETKDASEFAEQLDRIESKLDLFMGIIAVQQKDICEAIGITPATVRNKFLRGEIEILQGDGSRLVYLTLEQAGDLKRRRSGKQNK